MAPNVIAAMLYNILPIVLMELERMMIPPNMNRVIPTEAM